ncbi:RNA polymerase sigma factor [Lentzea sp. NPDC051213]|uniref:RNA polymerase sigma factor n=1 Tax=Lentzea sp. NPDC051213 TaxID=3364126 RepID=UPI0037ACBD9B
MSNPPESFDDFFRREIRSLVTFVLKLGYDAEDARDAAAQAMTMAYQHWERLTNPLAWVRVAAQRIALRHARRKRAGTACAIQLWSESREVAAAPSELIEGNHRVLALLDILPSQQREVMVWHMDGFETDEIARHLGVSEATVRSTKRHARNLLKKKLEDLTRRPGEEGPGYGS